MTVLAETVVDQKKVDLFTEYFLRPESEFSLTKADVFLTDLPDIELTAETKKAAKKLECVLSEFAKMKNELSGCLNGDCIEAPTVEENKILISKKLLNALDISKKYGHDLDLIYDNYDLAMRPQALKTG